MASPYQKKAERHKVLPGFPMDECFSTPEKLNEYFGGNKIVCMRCGKKYRTLGVHLKTIHQMEPDEYREIYGIPWTYGLSCAATTQLHADEAKRKIESGEWTPSAEQARLARLALPDQRKRQPVRDVLTERNLAALNKGKTGEEAARRKKAPKRGSPEHKQNLKNRPGIKERGREMGLAWKGKKQSPEHLRNRMKAINGETWEPN